MGIGTVVQQIIKVSFELTEINFCTGYLCYILEQTSGISENLYIYVMLCAYFQYKVRFRICPLVSNFMQASFNHPPERFANCVPQTSLNRASVAPARFKECNKTNPTGLPHLEHELRGTELVTRKTLSSLKP